MKIQSATLLFILFFFTATSYSQKNKSVQQDKIYVDKQGLMRWKSSGKEANFFGVNYTVPFAYGYRSHKALGIDLEKAIDADVYHMARLGLDAFRVHVWDTEITDASGNLLDNEHLRLFDYLLFKLKERNIKILITPIAFWGNGYPEKDIPTKGFSNIYPKQKALVNDTAIAAQENYLKQFFSHVNPYTKLSYHDDAAVIAMEINNEPHHSGPKEKVTEYINRMAKAVRSTGWTKPVFYNISESPAYADAVSDAQIDGVSFQWYPTGLVANHTLQGNYLPNVDVYKIPFEDTIQSFSGKARMIYEFDAGDVWQPIMYPAMARSFRTAGFQWATQFAYDPLATAYGNTEYQTHFVNLVYTPSKAISLLIAAKVFKQVPLYKNYGSYPSDTLFDQCRISYTEQLSEINSAESFYYSNNTSSKPINSKQLKHIAGVGNSAIVRYTGTGAYFLDKVKENVWRLEVLPDAFVVSDPFGKTSPKKEVVQLQWQEQQMHITLPDLGETFVLTCLSSKDKTTQLVKNKSFMLKPGTYLLSKQTKPEVDNTPIGSNNIQLNEFVSPDEKISQPQLIHQPAKEIIAGKEHVISFCIAGITSKDSVFVQARKYNWQYNQVTVTRTNNNFCTAIIPAQMAIPGLLQYKIVVKKEGGDWTVFPGNYHYNPFAWDNQNTASFETYVVAKGTPFYLFDANEKSTNTNFYLPNWRNYNAQYITADKPNQLVLQLNGKTSNEKIQMAFQHFIGDKLKERANDLSAFSKLVIRARYNGTNNIGIKVGLIDTEASCYTNTIILSNTLTDIELPLSSLEQDAILLLPRPYPSFMPFLFLNSAPKPLQLKMIERLQLTVEKTIASNNEQCSMEIESVLLK